MNKKTIKIKDLLFKEIRIQTIEVEKLEEKTLEIIIEEIEEVIVEKENIIKLKMNFNHKIKNY